MSIFKKLDTIYDSELCTFYDLCIVNALELKIVIDKAYSNVSKAKIGSFNLKTKMDLIIEMLEYSKMSFDLDEGSFPDFNEIPKHKRRNISEQDYKEATENLNHSHSDKALQRISYEAMPMAISMKKKDLNDYGSIQLLDGFTRMFWIKDIPNHKLIVKVYDELNDRQWANAMLLFNSWKLASTEMFFDKGFKLGIYKRHGIDMSNEKYLTLMLVSYVNDSSYETLKDNDVLHKDIECFIHVGRKMFEFRNNLDDAQKENFYKYVNYVPVFLYIAFKLGNYRREEFINELDRDEFDLNAIDGFFENKDTIKHLLKLISFTSDSASDKYFEKHVKTLLDKYV